MDQGEVGRESLCGAGARREPGIVLREDPRADRHMLGRNPVAGVGRGEQRVQVAHRFGHERAEAPFEPLRRDGAGQPRLDDRRVAERRDREDEVPRGRQLDSVRERDHSGGVGVDRGDDRQDELRVGVVRMADAPHLPRGTCGFRGVGEQRGLEVDGVAPVGSDSGRAGGAVAGAGRPGCEVRVHGHPQTEVSWWQQRSRGDPRRY